MSTATSVMTKQQLFRLTNVAAVDRGFPPITPEYFTKTLSILEIQGYVETYGDEVIILREYPGVK